MSEKMNAMIEQAEKDLLHTYNRYQIVLDHGDGVYLYDVDGKRYLDFVAGIAVFALGYNNKEYNDALKAQIDKILHTSNYFYNEPAIRAAHALKKVSGMDRVFFTNSGAESVEGALKAAVKHAWLKQQEGNSAAGAGEGKANAKRPSGEAPDKMTGEPLPFGMENDFQIIAMKNSFHGRTYGALSVTGNPHYREAFGRMPCDVQFADYNDLESVKALVNEKTAGIILETVQGEGGLTPATEEFLRGVRQICDEKQIPMILDEVQCGMGRTGSMYAFQKFGIRPDILCTAKALGCGVPVGAFLLTEDMAQHSLVAGDHGTTYGGNPFATAAVCKVLELYEKLGIVDHVKETAPYFWKTLDEIMARHACILEHRGSGFMQGLVFDRPVGKIITEAMDRGLILINAGANILRFVPPLVITKKDIDDMAEILDPVITKVCG